MAEGTIVGRKTPNAGLQSSVRWICIHGCPRRLLFCESETKMPIKKNQLHSLPVGEGRRMVADVYTAPPPSAHGRVVALDCHPDTFTAVVVRGTTPHNACKVSSRENLSLESLFTWVSAEFSSEDLFVMEAGCNSFEICRRLQALGLRAAVLESAHVGKQAKTYADDDKTAAGRIALVYLAGNAPCVWLPDEKTCQRRELLHVYQKAVSDHTASVNALKSYLNQFTIRLGRRSPALERTRQWIFAQRDWTPVQRILLTDYLTELTHHAQRRADLLRIIGQEICAEPLMLRCMKLLGIGKINAFALLAIIGDVTRFARPEKLVAYLGLNPGQRNSGESKRVKLGLQSRGRMDLRNLLIQGAQAVMRTGASSALGKWGWKLFARKGIRNVAVAAVARKLAIQAWHLLSGNPPELLETDKILSRKLQKLLVALGKNLRAEMRLPATIEDGVRELRRRITDPSPIVA